MKQLLVLIMTLVLACNSGKEPVNETLYSEKAKQDILLGDVDRSSFEDEPYREWFVQGYASYEIDQVAVKSIPATAWDELKIVVVLATWCPDSRRELPRFLKILDQVGFPEDDIQFIAVNREKNVPSMDLNYLSIERVPTFVFFKGSTEIGRIIESPDQSLEMDMAEFMIN